MPELPEVETTVKGLNILIGLKVYKVKIHTKKLRYIIPKSIIKIQKDSKITNIQRIAKYILIHFSSNFSIVIQEPLGAEQFNCTLVNEEVIKDEYNLTYHRKLISKLKT